MNEVERQALAGNPVAEFCLGLMYEHGHGLSEHSVISRRFESDPQKAISFYRRAAESGLAWAQFNLAWLIGEVEHNRAEAEKWYRRAAEQGHTDSQIMLAHFYKHGVWDCVSKKHIPNYLDAYIWYLIAIKLGHSDLKCSNVLAICEHRLTPQQIDEGRRKAASFTPSLEKVVVS